jgi:3-phenylpropionate/cinnamic acid dioxygenase small subunit
MNAMADSEVSDAAAWAGIDRDALRDFFDDYYTVLDDVRLDEWPAFFTEDCLYRVIPRENYEAGYTLCTIQAESRGMLVDRVMGLTRTQMYAPRYYRRFPGPLRIVSRDNEGVRTRHNLLLVQTLIDKQTDIVLSAVCHDLVVRDEAGLRLRQRIVVFDSEMIPNSLIYPA